MVATVLVAAAILALIHLYYFEGKSGKIDFVYFFVLLAVMGFNSQNADYVAYEEIYKKVTESDSLWTALSAYYDKGYVFLNWLSVLVGLDFAEFYFLCYAFLLGIIFTIARILGAPACVVYLIYMVYPMFMDVIQIRNFFISVLFLFSIYCYAHRDGKWYFMGSMILLLAIFIQPLAMLFLLFILFYFLYDSVKFRKVTYVFIVLGLLYPAIKNLVILYWVEIISFLNLLAVNFSRGEKYVGNQILDSRLFKIYLVVIIFTCILYRVKNYICSLDNVRELQKEFVRLAFVAYLYLICWIPFFNFSLDFATRFPRDCFLIAYIAVGVFIRQCHIKKKQWRILLLTVFLAYFFGLVDLYISSMRFNIDIILYNNRIL